MNDRDDRPAATPIVGSRVKMVASTSERGSVECTGVVIEDYADMVLDASSLGRDWAPAHRWAIALDDGRLVFGNDEDIALSP